MARYRKIDPRIWKDENFLKLTEKEKLIAIYGFTAQSNRIGIFTFSPGEASEDLGTFPQTFLKPFGKVTNTLHWRWDSKVRVLYIPTWWKYNCPENPNVLKACLSDLHDIPQTALFQEFAENLAYLPETFHQTFREGLPKPSTKPSPNQEQEQEQDKEQKQEQEQDGDRAASRSQVSIPISDPEPKLVYGEFGWCLLSASEHEKLLKKLGSQLQRYIDRFDRWMDEQADPHTRKLPAKFQKRKAYNTILNWSDSDLKDGTNGNSNHTRQNPNGSGRQATIGNLPPKPYTPKQ